MRNPSPPAAAALALLALTASAARLQGVQDPAEASSELPDFDARTRKRFARLSPLPPAPPDSTNRYADDPAAAHLGQFLFFDPRLSRDGTISCATCHVPEKGLTDGKSLAEGLGVGTRHTPTLWNVAHQRWFFWDGRADSLWAQILGPIENPLEMGSSRLAVAHVLARDDELAGAYEAIFGALPELSDHGRFPEQARPVEGEPDHPHQRAWDRMTEADRDAVNRVVANVGKAIAAYERKLVRGSAPFDRFVEGLADDDPEKLAALDPSAQRGLALFVGRARCVLCHSGPNLSDSEFHNTSAPPLEGDELTDPGRYEGSAAVVRDPFNAAGAYSDDTAGAAASRIGALRQTSESWGEFKTPSLRNLDRNGPFMHQGQFGSLRAVLDFYSTLEGAAGRNHHQEQILVPLRLAERETLDLLSFLASLAGAPLPADLLRRPDSPRRRLTDQGAR